MPMKLVLDTLEGLDATLHPLYEKREDGKFQLAFDPTDLEELPFVVNLKKNETAARRAERAMKTQIEKWEKLGKTDEEITALIAKQEKDAEAEAERKGEWEKLRAQMNEKHGVELNKKDLAIKEKEDKAEKLRSQIERYLVDAKATAAIAAAEGEPELLLPLVKKFIKVAQGEDGEFSTSIVDDKGGPRVNGKGDPLTVEELLAEFKASEKLGRAFKASGASGGGSAPGGGSNPKTPAGVPKSWSEAKTPEDKAKFIAHQKTVKQPAAA